VWPDGLSPLVDTVHRLGMQFGLWFEPEMVNPGSRVALEHPDWLLAADPLGPSWRHQYVLNTAHPDAFAYLLEHIDVLVRTLGIAFLKWDHNRDLHEAVDRRTGAVGVHAQTLATYALMDELQRRNPGLEIESCASGGARVDLGVLQHTQRIWTSDTNDAIERQAIQRWTGLLVPPELVGSHVGPARAHTTDRELDLSFRLLTALLGHAGIEWDVSACTEEELERLRAWAALYKRIRSLIATGVTVRADHVRPGSLLHGIVAPDRRHGVLAWVQLEAGASATSERVPLPGLDPALRYRVELRQELGPVARRSVEDPPWLAAGPVELAGAVLAEGVPLPALQPGQGLLLELTAI
jgi:alpha-galactosidase